MWALCFVVAFFVAQGSAIRVDKETVSLFQQFKLKYNKTYATPKEHSQRFAVFRDNLSVVEELNKREGLCAWQVG